LQNQEKSFVRRPTRREFIESACVSGGLPCMGRRLPAIEADQEWRGDDAEIWMKGARRRVELDAPETTGLCD
jgi:hypothetical protein